MEIRLPKFSLVTLIGISGSGKSTFARRHFLPTEVLSSDQCRAFVADDENDQSATGDAFEILHFIAAKRLAAGRLTVIDATNVQPEARKPIVELARRYHALPVAILFDVPERVCQERNRQRPDRNFGGHVIRNQASQLRRSIRNLRYEGFNHVFKLSSGEAIESATVIRVPLWNDRTDLRGPFDIIGDVHGCCEELEKLLDLLGYQVTGQIADELMRGPVYTHPENRMCIFLGDLVDRGPRIIDTLRLVYNMVQAGNALCVPGNHDIKLLRKLQGKDVQIVHGLARTLDELAALPADEADAFQKVISEFIDRLVSHYTLDGGRLVVAHAGLKQEMQGRGSSKVRDFCLFGETTGETDVYGLPVRHDWAADYRGPAMVVYGHTPVPEAEWLNRTINIDTGCVFGGKLTALRYPEKEIVSVPARILYCQPAKPFLEDASTDPGLTAQQVNDDLLDAADVLGKRLINTRLKAGVTIPEENAAAALEVMSRFAANPKWLIYLPPTMSPTETSRRNGYLEYPEEAFEYYRSHGIPQVVCEQKHMGSRAVLIVCRDEETSVRRFGIRGEGSGIVYTRTGRSFFSQANLEQEFIRRVQAAMESTGFWNEFQTDWACLDCELMPWSEKAQDLLKNQYAAVGTAALMSLDQAVEVIEATSRRSDLERGFEQPPDSLTREFDLASLQTRMATRRNSVERFIQAYRQYCWPVKSMDDFKLAPFHLMATEGKVYIDQTHEWHMTTLAALCAADPGLLLPTPWRIVDVTDTGSIRSATEWWEALTAAGGEGMVVKPHDFVSRSRRGLVQPALKCRGREYLRIIYGPEYTEPDNLERLRSRALGTKRTLALREFALGVEALERFVRREPLRRVHECVFGVLAMESEPVDPRL